MDPVIIAILDFFEKIGGHISKVVHQYKEKRKQKLTEIIKEGIGKFTTYPELYLHLNQYHFYDFEIAGRSYHKVDYSYFKETLSLFSDVKFSKEASDYIYPLVFKKKWLKSCNNALQIELNPIKGECALENYKLFPLSDKFLKSFGISNYINFLEKDCQKKVWKQTTFDLFKIEDGQTIKLSCCKGNYEYFVRTYELIQKEFYYNHVTKSKKFDLRRTIKFDKLEDYSLRPVKLGLNVFMIMKKKDGSFCTFIQTRKKDQVEYPSFYHVVPAGTFQPVCDTKIDKQYTFGFTIFREVLEEIFDMEEVDKGYQESDPLRIFSLYKEKAGYVPISPGEVLLGKDFDLRKPETENYILIPTGFLIDISSFKPEITFLLYIYNPDVYEKLEGYLKSNWEGPITEYDLTNGEFFKFLCEYFKNKNLLPAGAVAICEGLKWYATHLMKKC